MVFGSSTCNRSCGDGLKQVPFPFGFSSGCEIPLNCTSGNGTMSIGEFPVYQLTPGTIMINIPVKCGRRIEAMKPLFGKNFAPTVNNGILLQNCSSPELKCMIPSTMIQTQFELQECGKDNISCFSDPQKIGGFIGYGNLTGTGCKSLFSAISSVAAAANTTAVSLDIQVLELGWWLRGHCRCSKNANCTEIRPPGDGKPGFRCRCFEGFTGDGYLAGSGCRRDDTRCSPAKYLLGQCGGKTRIGVLIGGVIAGAALMFIHTKISRKPQTISQIKEDWEMELMEQSILGSYMMMNGEKPLSFSTNKPSEKVKEPSPVSVQDPWVSEQSSPSSNSFINQAMQRFKRSISLPA
nr:wall-associated receptor kinase-like 14 [Ipomoea trifida]